MLGTPGPWASVYIHLKILLYECIIKSTLYTETPVEMNISVW